MRGGRSSGSALFAQATSAPSGVWATGVAVHTEGRLRRHALIPRVVEALARRLQVQERMTRQIAELLEELVEPRGVGVDGIGSES